jgi:hypothetical protein
MADIIEKCCVLIPKPGQTSYRPSTLLDNRPIVKPPEKATKVKNPPGLTPELPKGRGVALGKEGLRDTHRRSVETQRHHPNLPEASGDRPNNQS